MIKKSLSGFEYEPVVFQDGISEVNLRDLYCKSYDDQPWLVEATDCIYLITNLVNGKVYVGRASYFYARFVSSNLSHLQEIRDCSYLVLNRAIRKYKSRNFIVEILAEGLEDTKSWENYYISEFKSCIYDNPCFGYNMTYGGGGYFSITYSRVRRKENGN